MAIRSGFYTLGKEKLFSNQAYWSRACFLVNPNYVYSPYHSDWSADIAPFVLSPGQPGESQNQFNAYTDYDTLRSRLTIYLWVEYADSPILFYPGWNAPLSGEIKYLVWQANSNVPLLCYELPEVVEANGGVLTFHFPVLADLDPTQTVGFF